MIRLAAAISATWLGFAAPAGAEEAAFRICADPANPPLTNRDPPGFENEIAALLAQSMDQPLEVEWRPFSPGYLRQTLMAGACDAVFGFEAGHWLVDTTAAYYASAYAIVVRADGPLATVTALNDPLLAGRPLGVVAGSPPAAHLARLGRIGDVRPYRLTVDQPFEGSAAAMLEHLGEGVIEAAILWGPLVGPRAAKIGGLRVTPLIQEKTPPALVYRMAVAVRKGDDALRTRLDDHIARNAAGIAAILARWSVPVVQVEPLN